MLKSLGEEKEVASGIGEYFELSAGVHWEQRLFNAGFSRRGWGQLLSHGETLWMLGGFNVIGKCLNDIWVSTDAGKSWNLQNHSCDWPGRAVFAAALSSCGTHIYVLGGSSSTGSYCSDVWLSQDGGLSWSCQTEAAPWEPRSGFACLVNPTDPRDLSILGGTGANFLCLNDVWRSLDGGKTWAVLNPECNWAPRVDMGVCQTLAGDILLSGGDDWSHNFYSDLYISSNRGKSWTLVNRCAPWQPRAGHALLALPDGSLRLLGGNVTCLHANKMFHEVDVKRLADVWASRDLGQTWTCITEAAEFGPRTLLRAVSVSNGRILVLGGWQGAHLPWQQGNVFYADIWQSEADDESITQQMQSIAGIVPQVPTDIWNAHLLPFLFPI